MKTNPILKLLLCITLPLAVGGLSGFITSHEVTGEWFYSLSKPSFNPPDYIFGPVWTILYLLMGISLFLILQTPKTEFRNKALLFFSLQLFFNFLWSILFFSFHLLFISILDIVLTWVFIVCTIEAFRKIKPLAAYLQLPYLLWVTFATLLNISIWLLNK